MVMILASREREMIKKLSFLLGCPLFVLMPFVAGAAGTYYDYNGTTQRNYNNPFYNYGANNAYKTGCPSSGCGGNSGAVNATKVNTKNNTETIRVANTQNTNRNTTNRSRVDEEPGFRLDAGVSHQFAGWDFEMKNAGSRLHYDNLHWNVLDVSGKYDFNFGNTVIRLGGGVQYGKQFGDSPMVDDDITNGAYTQQKWSVDLSEPADGIADQTWVQEGHALSVGTSSDGTMFGYYAGLGLVDVWRTGSFRMTPSIGYRHFRYTLDTKQNYGLSLDTISGADGYCQSVGGETQCIPFLVFVDPDNQPLLGTIGGIDLNGDGVADTTGYVVIPGGAAFVETENTYYYYQSGVSHSYEVEWSGPYLALDMTYDVSQNDSINARFEFGLPAYTATADQPYRPDWQHPKSLEDKGSIGDAYHFGFGANWLHSLTDSVMLTVGMIFDYYTISNADATTYLNSEYYNTYFYNPAVESNQELVDHYGTDFSSWPEKAQAIYLYNLENVIEPMETLAAAGWQQESKDEIESLYKSLGIRVGIRAKF